MAVFCEGNYTLTTQCNIFWDFEIFWMIAHFVAVFCVENDALNAWRVLFYFLDVCYVSPQKPVVLQTILPCFNRYCDSLAKIDRH